MALSARGSQRAHNRSIALPQRVAGDIELPVDALAQDGVGTETAYEILKTELLLDGQAQLNLATFVTTWMPELAGRLMSETADKNMIDKDEYPQTAKI
jgi:glutamate decarboxylase